MLNEIKIFFENVNKVRKFLLNEAVSPDRIVDSINNHEFIYLYYSGDDTIERGIRTVRPYVIGKTSEGNVVLRAWQDAGKSDSLRADSIKKRYEHEYWNDLDGKEKPGWRLFRVDKIAHVYPSGERFNDENGNVLIPPKYKEGSDEQMKGGIIAYVSTKKADVKTQGQDSVLEPNVTTSSSDEVVIDTPAPQKFKEFYFSGNMKRQPSERDIENLYNIATRVKKKSVNNYIVASNNKGDFKLINSKYQDKIPKNAFVGSLNDLYKKYVLPSKQLSNKANEFIKNKENDAINKLKNNQNTFQRKTFFK